MTTQLFIRILLSENDLARAIRHVAKPPSMDARRARGLDESIHGGLGNDHRHPAAHVERAKHLGAVDAAGLLQLSEDVWNLPSRRIDHSVEILWQRAIQVTWQPTTSDVGHGAYGRQQRLERCQVRTVNSEENVCNRLVFPGKGVRSAKMHTIGNDATRERVAVGMKTSAFQPNENITLLHARWPEDRVLVDVAHDKTCKIVIGRRIDARHLRSLTADQRTAVLAASRSDASDDIFDNLRIERAERHVVEKK